ncbi:MAG: transporter [Pseudomonas sp.]
MKLNKNASLAASAAALLSLSAPCLAIDGSPADYTWFPSGTKLFLLYGQYSSASSLRLDGIGELPQSRADILLGLVRGVSYQEVAGMRTSVQFFVPFATIPTARIAGVDQPVSNGVGDLTVGATLYPLASSDPTGTTVGVTLFVGAPTGNYQLGNVNLSTGTWVVTPQAALIQGLGNGVFFDAIVDMAFTRSKVHQGVKIEQDESSQIQTYLRYQFSPATSVSVGYSGRWGGEQYVDGVYAGTRTRNDQVRIVGSTFITPKSQLQLLLGRDVKVEGGFKNDLVAQVRYAMLF